MKDVYSSTSFHMKHYFRFLPIFLLAVIPCIFHLKYAANTAPMHFRLFGNSHLMLLLFFIVGSLFYFLRRFKSFQSNSLDVIERIFLISFVCAVCYNFTSLCSYPLIIPIATVLIASIFCISSIFGKVASIFCTALFLFIGILSNCLSYLGIAISTQNIAELIEASWGDAKHFVTFSNIGLLLFLFIISAIAPIFMLKVSRREKKINLFFYGIFFLSISFFQSFCYNEFPEKAHYYKWPIGAVSEVIRHTKHAIHLTETAKLILANIPQAESISADSEVVNEDSEVVCILHIGESLRADRLNINGYKRNTTPWLEQQELINFPHCISCAWATDGATLTMLTNSRRAYSEDSDIPNIPTSGSITDFFAAVHFQCAAFWGNSCGDQNIGALFKREMDFYGRSAENVYYNKDGDMKQLSTIANHLERFQGKNRFLIINNEGSHMPFNSYDHKNPPFTPVKALQPPRDSPTQHPEMEAYYNNAYDNTVRQTDDFIKNLLEPLKGKPYVYIYMSDHGEVLGDGGNWLRGALNKENYFTCNACNVPFIIIASPEFESLNPHFHDALCQLRNHQQMIVAHEHLFHTLLGLFDIKTKDYDSSLDLCSPNVKPYTGPHPNFNKKEK